MVRNVFTLVFLLVFSAGCMSLDVKSDEGLKTILEAYKKENASLQQKQKERQNKGIKKFSVVKSGDDYLVSLDAQQTSLPVVIKRILEESKMAYQMGDIVLQGRATSRFEKLPIVSAMNLLLSDQGYSCSLQDGILIFSHLQLEQLEQSDPKAPPQPLPSVQKEVTINFLDEDSITSILDGLYPINPTVGIREKGINFAVLPNRSMLYISGPADEVQKAIQIIRAADRDPAHVVIEVMVVEFDSDAFEKLGADLSNVATGEISDLATQFGSLTSNAITFTQTSGVSSVATFTAAVDLLVQQEKAKLITRPYLSTLSGRPAQIHITRDRYVVTQEAQSGASITTTTPISSGVMMQITPFIRPGEKIRLDVEVEDSQFIPTTGNVVVEVDKNSATTSMMVSSGQSIIIGGLVLNQESVSNAGLPWVRHIPVLNWLFAKQQRDENRREVMIYLTPTIWEPGLTPPLVAPDALTIPENESELSPLEQLR